VAFILNRLPEREKQKPSLAFATAATFFLFHRLLFLRHKTT
jgi:hypothetical protein